MGSFAVSWRKALLCLVGMLSLLLTVRSEGIVYVGDQGFDLRYVSGTSSESQRFSFAGIAPGLEFSGPMDDSPWWDVTGLTRQAFQVVSTDVEESARPARFDIAVEIGAGLDWRALPSQQGLGLASIDGSGEFFDSKGFLGVRAYFETNGWEIEDALPYYGWIRVSHSAEDSVLTFNDWAWNSAPGETILAGEIPEPKVYALLLGIGALVFVAGRPRWRRRSVVCGK